MNEGPANNRGKGRVISPSAIFRNDRERDACLRIPAGNRQALPQNNRRGGRKATRMINRHVTLRSAGKEPGKRA